MSVCIDHFHHLDDGLHLLLRSIFCTKTHCYGFIISLSHSLMGSGLWPIRAFNKVAVLHLCRRKVEGSFTDTGTD